MIYLDNAATTQIDPEVLDAMLPYITEQYGNAGAIYGFGQDAAAAVAKARERVADFIGAEPNQIIFTSGGTEANNLAILGSKSYVAARNKKHIITSRTEHDSVLKTIESFSFPEEKYIKGEFYISYLPADIYGQVSVVELRRKLRAYNDIGLVSVMGVNNELGTENNIAEIGDLCHEYGAMFHTDCVQAAGTIELDVNKIGCDFLSMSAHKIHAPKGVGALYTKDKNVLTPIIYGGDEQEFGLRGGTANVAGIVGFGKACEIAKRDMSKIRPAVYECKTTFVSVLHSCMCDYFMSDTMCLNCNPYDPHSKILSITFQGVDAQTLILMLDSENIQISAGSACRSRESIPSRTMIEAGLSAEDARSTVRISFSKFNTDEQADEAARRIASCVKILRGVCE